MQRIAMCLLLAAFVVGCEHQDALLTAPSLSPDAAVASSNEGTVTIEAPSSTELNIQYQKISALVASVNGRLESAGSDLRLGYPYLFVVGAGRDPEGVLRTGSRWTTGDLTYILDGNDFTADVSADAVEDAMIQSYETWNDVGNTGVQLTRQPAPTGNFDILDGKILDQDGECVDVLDLTADNLIFQGDMPVSFLPQADVFMGGWLPPDYFADCLGSSNILGVTWSFSVPDGNDDGYRDFIYVEQFYNEEFSWTTTGAVYLDFTAPIDIQTISAHENGHALGLDHFGGPIRNQPFKVKPNGRVYNPEAVMNFAYLGGEKRSLYPTDIAGLRTLYARNP